MAMADLDGRLAVAVRREQGPALEEVSARIVGGLPRPVPYALVQGFLSAVRAHASASQALEYAATKRVQAERQGQRVEQQFWGQVHEALTELPTRVDAMIGASDVALRDRLSGILTQMLAQHLSSENWLRLGHLEDANGGGASARRGPASRPARPPWSGG